jgi:UDP-glucuronate decarboxylase
VVSNFIIQALEGEDITIYGDGSQTRSFCYVDDTVDGIIRMMNTPRGITGPVNLGNPNEISILDLARLIIDLTGSRSRIVFKPLPQDDPRRRCPDITLAREKLGWKPKIDLMTGLKKTVEYFSDLIRREFDIRIKRLQGVSLQN